MTDRPRVTVENLVRVTTQLPVPALPWTGAVISGEYRYFLARAQHDGFLGGVGSGTVCFVMLNPSTAGPTTDDPTVRRCMGFAWDWGYGRMTVVNLFALRATDPRELKRHPDPCGMRRQAYARAAFAEAHLVVCAWGANPIVKDFPVDVFTLAMIVEAGLVPYVLRLTKAGAPAHPLYLPKSLKPVEWKENPL